MHPYWSLSCAHYCAAGKLSDYECNLSHRASVGAHDRYICTITGQQISHCIIWSASLLMVLLTTMYMHTGCQSTLERYLIWSGRVLLWNSFGSNCYIHDQVNDDDVAILTLSVDYLNYLNYTITAYCYCLIISNECQ